MFEIQLGIRRTLSMRNMAWIHLLNQCLSYNDPLLLSWFSAPKRCWTLLDHIPSPDSHHFVQRYFSPQIHFPTRSTIKVKSFQLRAVDSTSFKVCRCLRRTDSSFIPVRFVYCQQFLLSHSQTNPPEPISWECDIFIVQVLFVTCCEVQRSNPTTCRRSLRAHLFNIGGRRQWEGRGFSLGKIWENDFVKNVLNLVSEIRNIIYVTNKVRRILDANLFLSHFFKENTKINK